jgi:hypothetical protein
MWGVACAAGLVVFVLYRKRKADIGHDVAEEVDHNIRRILKAAREAEEQLRDAFLHFQNQSGTVQSFQKARGDIAGAPRASPTWNWSDADLELQRKRTVADETAHRCRPWAFASIVGVVALTVGTAVASVILSNSVQPVVAPTATPASVASYAGGFLPPPLPTLPQVPPPPDITGNPLTASAPGANSGVAYAQGGASVQGGQPLSSPGAATAPATAATSLPPQANAPTPPPVPQAPGASTSNAPNGPAQDAQDSKTCTKGVAATIPNQLGENP